VQALPRSLIRACMTRTSRVRVPSGSTSIPVPPSPSCPSGRTIPRRARSQCSTSHPTGASGCCDRPGWPATSNRQPSALRLATVRSPSVTTRSRRQSHTQKSSSTGDGERWPRGLPSPASGSDRDAWPRSAASCFTGNESSRRDWTAGWEPYLPPRRGLQGRPLPPSDPN